MLDLTISFYKYFKIDNPLNFRNIIYKNFYKLNIFGRIYIATEGINAQISVLYDTYFLFKKHFYNLNSNFKDIKLNKSINHKQSFWVLIVKVRKKIVADGLLNYQYNAKNVGKYLQIKDVNSMLKNPKVIFVDIRNDYEYEIGHFKNAIHVPGKTFRDQLKIIVNFLKKYKNKIFVLYCTGGIRCEKATAWLKFNNFKNIYHIKGGILNYVNESRKKNFSIFFRGKNFVFDYRMSERISHHILSKCKICNIKCDNYINCKNDFCHDLVIQCSACYFKYHGCCSIICKKKLINNF